MSMVARAKRMIHEAGRQPESDSEILRSTLQIGVVVLLFALGGLVEIGLWSAGVSALGPEPRVSRWTLFAGHALLAGAAASVGGLLGFIFAVPRTLDPPSKVAIATAADAMPAESRRAALSANTNLERISDWLTTLLIGATLAQAGNIATWLSQLGPQLFTTPIQNANIVPLVVVFFAPLTFLGVYLVTRLYLTYALQKTLVLLTGVPNPSMLSRYRADVASALSSGDPGEMIRAATQVESGSLFDTDSMDPPFNADRVRLYAKMLSGKVLAGRSDSLVSQMQAAARLARASSDVRARLLDDVVEGRVTTGNSGLDLDLKNRLAP